MKVNVGEWMKSRSNLLGEKEAFVGKYGRYTFQQMNERVNRFANYLLNQGIKSGDRVALICKNHEDYVTAFFGSAKVGVITVPVNWRLQTKEKAYILEHSEPKVVIYDEVLAEQIEELKSLAEIFICSGNSETDITYGQVLQSSTEVEPTIATFNEDTILMMYTSGTTGKPKGAMFSHNNLFSASIGLTHTIDWWEQDRFLLVAPLFHIGGFAPLLANVHTGCSTILLEDFDPINVWKTIEKEKITTMMSVPAMLSFMAQTVKKVNTDYSTLRNITCGASGVPVQLIEAFQALGISVQQVYGITEYTGAVSFWKKSLDSRKFDSVGKAVMHGKLKIIDIESQKELSFGEDGEILCSGPQVFKGYWKNDEETAKVLINGWYHTGDIGRIDKDGFIYVIDRLKDLIISGGENIYSAEVEAALSTHKEIVECAVVGKPDAKWGEIPCVFVVKTADSTIDKEGVIDYCKEILASYKIPKEVVFVDHLPRNAVGKILKTVLKKADQVKI